MTNLPVPHRGDEYTCMQDPTAAWHVHLRLAPHADPGVIVAVEYVGTVIRLMKPLPFHVGYREKRLKRFFLSDRPFKDRLSATVREAIDQAARLNDLPLTGTEEEIQAYLAKQVEMVLAEPRPRRPSPTQ